MTISVIVPIYNAEKFLHYCIDSILNQSFVDFEILLVNDGSTDNSGKICDKYAEKDTRVKVIHKQNGGVSSARNAGIEAAKGEYICFVDSDDYLESNYLKELVETKRKYADYDNIWCGFQTVEDYNGKNKEAVIAKNDTGISCYSLEDIMILHERWLEASPCNKLFDKGIIINNKIKFPDDLSLGEDLLFNFEYLDCSEGKIVVINKPLYNYIRDGKESLDNKYYPNLLEIYRRLNSETEKYAQKWKLSEEQISKMYNSFFFRLEAVLRNTFNENNKSSLRTKLKYNNRILKSSDFRESMDKMNAHIHPFYRFAYKSKNYIFVLFLNLIVKIK